MNETQIVGLLTSGEGRLFAAGLLFALVAVSKRTPWLYARLDSPWKTRTYVIAMSVLPALALGLTTSADWKALVMTSATAAIGAMGLDSFGQRSHGKAAPLLVLLVVLSGCGSLLATAADVANAGAVAGETAAPLVTEFCVEPMKAALVSHDVGAARSIATRCDVPVEAYDTLRVVHVALRAAIVALASGRMPPDLPGLIVQMVDASAKLASSIGGLR